MSSLSRALRDSGKKGRAIALRLARDGCKVVLNDLERQASSLEDVRSQIKKEGGQASIQTGDVSLEQDVIILVQRAVEEYGSVDIMVANAGTGTTKYFIDCTPDDIDRVFSVNVKGTFLCYKYAALQMINAQGRGGRIIGAASIAAKQAAELGKHGITVNTYAPGGTETDMLKALLENRMRLDGIEPPEGPLTLGAGYMGRDMRPDDIAGVVSFLVSKDASMITGQSISVNGGAFFD